MLTNLLEELAREAPSDGDAPELLWRRGRRVARTQRLGTIAIAAVACVLLIALGTATWQQRAVDLPATDAETGTYLPTRFHPPSPYLPGTDSAGPMGRLVATIDASRLGWLGGTEGLVGVSAETGAYAFLDLPDAATAYLGEALLSPDGRHVAYWTTGEVADPIPALEGGTLNGYAVYDTVTGEVVTQTPRTERGIGGGTLVWFDPIHLGVEFGQMRDCCMSTDARSMIFDLSTGQTSAISSSLNTASTTGVGTVIVSGEESVILETDGTTVPAQIPMTGGRINGSQFLALTPDSKRVAAIFGNGIPGRISVKNVDDDDVGDPLPGNYLGVTSWLDESHVAALRGNSDSTDIDLVSVDISDGSTEVLSANANNARFAINLLDSPVKNQPAPPHPRSPWIPTIGAAATIAVAAWALIVWRRRARA
ncbi:hypothetical protein [Nocardioides sp.]|uniref:hypothetical protein n=1 Tax=Nocardioides sp. TaxID=35761 RepID=UPI0019954681|nr:hypothetical protein [Nocardioides sp.]MBC7279355.1 hypothetical protein [Nocardioides sp.]